MYLVLNQRSFFIEFTQSFCIFFLSVIKLGFSLFIKKPEKTNTISILLYRVYGFLQPCLNSVIKLRPQCLHLGERGVLLLCRFMSTAKGFKMLSDANFILNEVQKWEKVH